MALEAVTASFLRRLQASPAPLHRAWALQCRRHASSSSNSNSTSATLAAQEPQDLDPSTFHEATGPSRRKFDPVKTAFKRSEQLPPSRYHFRPPKYYRGELHPHQPPPTSDPASRAFVPGPFSLPRLEQTYHDTFASDLMTMTYMHFPPGVYPQQKGERYREWIGDSPYFKNRPRRGPRGGSVLRMLRKPITFRNVPQLERVTVHCMVKEAISGSAPLHVAGMVMQAITNVRSTSHATRKSVAAFGVRAGQHLSVTCELTGETMYHFLSKVVDVVMPKIKDFRGIKGSTGDNSGNLAFGLTPEDVALFPEVEVNYDMYPPKMIPGCHVIIHTSAKTDYDARLLAQAIGIPFYGKLVD